MLQSDRFAAEVRPFPGDVAPDLALCPRLFVARTMVKTAKAFVAAKTGRASHRRAECRRKRCYEMVAMRALSKTTTRLHFITRRISETKQRVRDIVIATTGTRYHTRGFAYSEVYGRSEGMSLVRVQL